MTSSSTPFVPLFAIEKLIRRARADEAAAFIAHAVHFVTQIPRRLRRILRVWNMRLNDREFLAGLHNHQLGDVGMTRDQRNREVNKPFWEE